MGTRHSLTRRQFLKAGAGTVVAFTTVGIPQLSQNAGANHDPSTPDLDFFNEKNFPNIIQRQQGIDLPRDKTRLLLVFRENQTTGDVKAFLAPADLILEDMVVETPPLPFERINHSKRHFWVRKKQPAGADAPIDEQTYNYLAQALQSKVSWVGPVHRYPAMKGREGLLCPSPNVLLLKLTPQAHGEIPPGLKKILDSAQLDEVPKWSQYLSPFLYFVLKKIGRQTVYAFQKKVLEGQIPFIEEARFENSPLLDPKMAPPSDPFYSRQWNLLRIGADTGWTICSGRSEVVVWIIDEGVDTVDDSSMGLPRPHPDIRFVHPGMDMETMDDISKTDPTARPDPVHGTNCAGIVGAITNNDPNPTGIAGLAGGALGPAGCNTGSPIYPLVFYSSPLNGPNTDVQVARAFSFATRVHKGELELVEPGYIATPLGSVANLSYAVAAAWDPAIVDPKIQDAFGAGIVICASTGNSDQNGVMYPASNPNVIACGASNRNDNRVELANGFGWGSNYGNKLSVVAPGVEIPTTDPQDWPGSPRGAQGDYHLAFGGTSAATTHVSGLAALLLSKYPYLTPAQVRIVIERTSRKVGSHATGSPPQYPSVKPNGTWHEQMGYGLINVADALNYPADVMIRDTLADTGVEPSSGVFWESPDIVIRPNLTDPFSDTDFVLKDQDNYLFVRVTNNGPGVATNVVVEARIVPYVGTEFTYPFDWKTNPIFVSPEPLTPTFTTVLPGMANQVIAKFRIPQADVNTLWDWSSGMSWHPCILAEVRADNDFRHVNGLPPLGGGSPTPQRNNLAQRNLTVVTTLLRSGVRGAEILYPFIMGSAGAGAGDQDTVTLHIYHGLLPRYMPILLYLDPDDTPFPRAGQTHTLGEVTVEVGGQLVNENGRRTVHLEKTETILRMQTRPTARYRIVMKLDIPEKATRGKEYALHILQKNSKNKTVGGATLVVAVK
jgi:subtilisin family serine protease